MQEVEKTVLEYVKPLTLSLGVIEEKTVELPKINEDMAILASKAGFKLFSKTEVRNAKAVQQNYNRELALETEKQTLRTAMEKLGLKILLQRPPFANVLINSFTRQISRRVEETTTTILPNAIIIKKQPISMESYQQWDHYLLVTKPELTYMVEIKPKDYKGELPDFAIKATAEAVEVGLIPMVWIAGTQQEVVTYMQKEVTRMRIDPLVVGYTKYPSAKCLLIAAWGKDLEAIDKYFQ